MSRGGREDDQKQASSVLGPEDAGDASAEEDLGKLIGALRRAAREDDLAAARLPAEAFAPLSAEGRARIADSIVHGQTSEAAREKPTTAGRGVVSIDSRRASRRLLAGVLGPLAAAAALVLLVRPFSGERPAPLPKYEISASGGIKELRGAEGTSQTAGSVAASQRLRTESLLVAIARPDVAVEGPIAVRVFVAQQGRVEEVWPRVQIATSGAVEVRAAVGEVFGGRTGRWDLVVLIGRSQELRRIDPTNGLAPSDPTARRLTVPLELGAP